MPTASAKEECRYRSLAVLAFVFLVFVTFPNISDAEDGSEITQRLHIARPGLSTEFLGINEAMRRLNIPSVGIALIHNGAIAWSRTFGENEGSKPVYEAASLSKFVTAVIAMKLVDEGVLSLDAPVDEQLKRWKPPPSPFTQGHPVTLRWLLSMRAGANVGGYIGYPRGKPIPNLVQILNGTPPATSPRVEIVSTPGETYAYSGGGYEIVEALIADATGESFDKVAKERVFDPVGMTSSVFGEPLPPPLLARAATGHSAEGSEVPGGRRVLPELAAAGLWSTPEDLAHLLTSVADSFNGRSNAVLTRTAVEEMLIPQGGGPYGLGAAVRGFGQDVSLRKRGQNVGYQGYLILFPARGEGMVVMTGSDNGSILADALIRRTAQVYGWPAIGPLPD